MPRLDHLSLPVRDWRKSRDWYKDHLGFEVEFEIPDRKTVAMRDNADLTIFLYEGEVVDCPGISFTIQVDDVEAAHDRLTFVQLSAVATTFVGTVGGVVSTHDGVVALAAVDCAEVLLALSVAETV